MKSGMLDDVNIFYLQLDDINDILNKTFRKNTRRGVKIQDCIRTLFEMEMIGNINHLMALI